MIHQRTSCALLVVLLSLYAAAQQAPAAGSHAPAPGRLAQCTAANTQQLPNAPSASNAVTEKQPYIPLTSHEKFERWLHYTYSPYLGFSTTLNAGYAQAAGDWPTYGGGMEGFGKRFGATLADTEARGLFEMFLLPTLLHQDPRYFHSGKTGVVPRAWYAITRVVVIRDDAGDQTFNTSEVLGTLFVKSLSNAYYPRRDRGFGETMSRSFGALLSDASSNVLREFWPDIRRVLRKHEPERVKKIQDKVPDSLQKAASPAGPGDE